MEEFQATSCLVCYQMTIYFAPCTGGVGSRVQSQCPFQFVKWNQQTTLADWVVSEGLAESLLLSSMVRISLGLWVTSTNPEQLEEIKPIISSQLQLTGMAEMALSLR